MYVRISKLRKVIAEQAQHLFEELKEDRDRLRRGVQDNWPGEAHDNFEEAIELEDFEFEAKKKDDEEPEADDEGGEENKEKPAFLKGKEEPKKAKKSPPKEKESEEDNSPEDSDEEEEPKKEPSPKHKKAKKGLEKAQKQKMMPKSQVDPATGVKQDVDLDALAQLATEAGYRLEKVEPSEPDPDDDFGLSDFDSGEHDHFEGDDDEMSFDLGPDGDEDHPHHEKDMEDEDVALFSSDEDLADVLGHSHEEPEEDETGLEGHPLSLKQASPVARQGATKQGGVKLRIR